MVFEEKDGKVFVNGIEYVPKETEKKLPTCYADIIEKHNYNNTQGYFISKYGSIYDGFDYKISTETNGIFYNKEFAQAMLILKNLLEIRDEYNGNWKPNWNCSDCDYDNVKYCIKFFKNEIQVGYYHDTISSEFIFKSKELTGQFLKNHREDIEFVFRNLYMWDNNSK